MNNILLCFLSTAFWFRFGVAFLPSLLFLCHCSLLRLNSSIQEIDVLIESNPLVVEEIRVNGFISHRCHREIAGCGNLLI